MGAGPLATVAMSVASTPSNGCHVRQVPPPLGGGPVLAGLVGPAVLLCGWPSGRRAIGSSGRRAVGPNFYNKIVSPLRALTRARARFVNLIVGVVIQKTIGSYKVPHKWGTWGTWGTYVKVGYLLGYL